jgi:hypothetical protein
MHLELCKQTRFLKAELDYMWYDVRIDANSMWCPNQYQYNHLSSQPVRSITTIGTNNKPFSFWFLSRNRTFSTWKIVNYINTS